MKRSEFAKKREEYWTAEKGDGVAMGTPLQILVNRDISAALEAGVTWDPEEPKDPYPASGADPEAPMLPVWGGDGIRLTIDGKWEMWLPSHGWAKYNPQPPFLAALAELRDRLMNEREELEKARNLGRDRGYQQRAARDPKEAVGPEVLWISPVSTGDPRRLRFTLEFLWELLEPAEGPEWRPWKPVPCIALLANELGRRLLEERSGRVGQKEMEDLRGGVVFPLISESSARILEERRRADLAAAGLPPNAQEVPAPDDPFDEPLLRRSEVDELLRRLLGHDIEEADHYATPAKLPLAKGRERCIPKTFTEELVLRREGWTDLPAGEGLVHGLDRWQVPAPDREHVTDGGPCWCGPETVSVREERLEALASDTSRHLDVIGRRLREVEMRDQQMTVRLAEAEKSLFEMREMGQRQFDRMELLESSVSRLIDRVARREAEDLLRRILDLERRVTALDDPTRS